LHTGSAAWFAEQAAKIAPRLSLILVIVFEGWRRPFAPTLLTFLCGVEVVTALYTVFDNLSSLV
jgi:hypothetical protein